MAAEAPTYRMLVTTFTDFLTVAIHTILYERKIYPETSFLSARKYNFPVRQNRHPKVCDWINDAVNAVTAELVKGTVERVAVVIYDSHNKPLERFVFDVSRLPQVPLAQVDMPLKRLARDGTHVDVLPLVDLDEQLRATMSRLANCSSQLGPLPSNCTFTVAVELRADSEAPLQHPQPWAPSEIQSDSGASNTNADNLTVPIRTVAAGEMLFETWAEEVNKDSYSFSSSDQ